MENKKTNLVLSWLSTELNKGGAEQLMLDIANLTNSEILTFDKIFELTKIGQSNYYHYSILDRNKTMLDYARNYAELNNIKKIIRNSGIEDLGDLPVKTINVFQDPYKDVHEWLFFNKFYPQLGLESVSFYEFAHYYPKLQSLMKGYNIAVSKYMKEHMESLNITCDKVINNSINPEIFNEDDVKVNTMQGEIIANKEKLREIYKIPKDKLVAIWVGNFYPNKWIYMPEIIKSNPDVHFILIFYKKSSYRPIWAKNVSIFSQIDRDKMKHFYLMSDFYISTSPIESFNLCALESLNCNRPIITFNTGFMKYSSNKEKYGIIINKHNLESYNNAIKSLDLSLKPRNTAINEFNYETFKNEWKDLISKD